MALRLIMVCTLLAGCSANPQVNWPAGPVGATPALYPLVDLIPDDSTAIDTRGAALAARAAALRAQVISIGTQ